MVLSKQELVEKALEKITNPQILVNVVSKRVRQLGMGERPMVFVQPKMTFLDVALMEIAEGKLYYEPIPLDEK